MRPLSPLVRATYQAAILSGISNVLAQAFQARRSGKALHLDPFELIRFIVVTLITCPPNFHWQQWLERTFPAYTSPTSHNAMGPAGEGGIPLDEKRRDSNVGDEASREVSGSGVKEGRRNWANTFKKMFIDCITIGALVNTVAFLVLMGLMKGQGWEKLMATVKRVSLSRGNANKPKDRMGDFGGDFALRKTIRSQIEADQ